MANVEMNYYNGSSYISLYPVINLNNNNGTSLSSSYIPNLSASKITSGTFNIARMPSNMIKGIQGTYTGTGTVSVTISTSFRTHACFVGGGNWFLPMIYGTRNSVNGTVYTGNSLTSSYDFAIIDVTASIGTSSIVITDTKRMYSVKLGQTSNNASYALNISGATYNYLALAII